MYFLNEYTSSKAEIEREISRTGLILGFSIISISFLIIFLLIVRCNWNCREFYEWNAIRLTMPAISLFLCVENATIAYDYEISKVSSQWEIAVYMISSTVAPGIFIFSFVMTFLAYRTRSMPFCFVHRGPGRQAIGESHQDEEDEVYQPLVRPAILVVTTRIFAIGLLVLNLLVKFDLLSDHSLIGLTGWSTVVKNPEESYTGGVFLALLPMALVGFLCLYFACLLWRYGCEFSMVINTSFFNAWLSPVFGALALLVGQCFGPQLFLITSNSGLLLYMISMTRVLYEIRHDIREACDLGHFLSALETARSDNNKEDTAAVTNKDSALSTKIVPNEIWDSTKSTNYAHSKENQSSSSRQEDIGSPTSEVVDLRVDKTEEKDTETKQCKVEIELGRESVGETERHIVTDDEVRGADSIPEKWREVFQRSL